MANASIDDYSTPRDFFVSVDAGETFRSVAELQDDLPLELMFTAGFVHDAGSNLYLWAGTSGSMYKLLWPDVYVLAP